MPFRDLITFDSQSPIIRREHGPFVRWTDLSDGLGIYGIVQFEREIVWLRECHCDTIVFDAEGQEIDQPSGYCDHSYGYLTCVREPFRGLGDSLRRYGVTQDGPLSVVVRLRVEENPAVEWEEESEFLRSRYSKRYLTIPKDWAYPDDPLFHALAAAKTREERWEIGPPAYVRRKTLFDGPLWSSRLGVDPLGQAKTRNAALEQAYAGLPRDVATETRARMERVFKAPAPQPTGAAP